MDTLQVLESIQLEIAQLRYLITNISVLPTVSERWVSRAEAMQFFNYGPTQMAALENEGNLVVAKIGKRKFILRESLNKLLDSHILPSVDAGKID